MNSFLATLQNGLVSVRRYELPPHTRKLHINEQMASARSLLASDALNVYLNTIKRCPKKGRDPTSLSFLVKRDISQSAAIRLGIVLEEAFNIMISEYLKTKYTRSNLQKNVKGERQKDVLMINETTKEVLYAELKNNINLDTQKSLATVVSTINVVKEYEAKGYTVTGYVLSLRYLQNADIPKTLAKKYQKFDDHVNVNLIGIQDFMKTVLNEPIAELKDYDAYSTFLTSIMDRIEGCN